jgi:hypothetical protein
MLLSCERDFVMRLKSNMGQPTLQIVIFRECRELGFIHMLWLYNEF